MMNSITGNETLSPRAAEVDAWETNGGAVQVPVYAGPEGEEEFVGFALERPTPDTLLEALQNTEVPVQGQTKSYELTDFHARYFYSREPDDLLVTLFEFLSDGNIGVATIVFGNYESHDGLHHTAVVTYEL
jgi:hypothetical protein